MSRRLLLASLCLLAACGRAPAPASDQAAKDSAFAALQTRGAQQMGVDQFTSLHVFKPLPDGGLISLQRESEDSAGTAVIRAHMLDIATRFATGDFTIPGLVHDQVVPGTPEMTALKARIRYGFDTLPRGASVRITTTDTAAVTAVHDFLEFQSSDHRVGVHVHR